MACLKRIDGDHLVAPREVTLADGLVIGRSPPDGGVAIDEPSMSRVHAIVELTDEWTVRDLDSFNGTKVDGRRLAPGEKAPLRAGTEVVFGAGARWVVA